MTKDGSTIDYKYDDSGIRQSKTVNGVTTNFTTIGGKITSQNDGTDSLYFRYDKDDSLIGVQVNGVEYLYIKNLQVSIIDYDGNIVVNYTYDSFGKVVSMTGSLAGTIGQLNPMRYRGYYYDSETGLYYLQSRYYDAEMQRFINADDTSVLQLSKEEAMGNNLFAYCVNNPVMNSDPSGMWLARLLSGAIVGTIFATLAFVTCKILNLDSKTTAVITIAFAAIGVIIGAVLGPSFLLKNAPNLLKAISQIEKTKFSLKAIGPNTGGNIFGIIISNILIIMLHAPHPKFNEWFFHIQIEVKLLGRKQFVIWKKPLLYVNPKTWGR